MSSSIMIKSILLVLLSVSCSVSAFAPASASSRTDSSLSMAKFDKKTQRWIATSEDEKTGGYGPFGTLIR